MINIACPKTFKRRYVPHVLSLLYLLDMMLFYTHPSKMIACFSLVVFTSAFLYSVAFKLGSSASMSTSSFLEDLFSTPRDSTQFLYFETTITEGVQLTLGLTRNVESDAKDTIALAPHQAVMQVNTQQCAFPRVWLRLVGPSLVSLNLTTTTTTSLPQDNTWQVWKSPQPFDLPLAGEYCLEILFHGCHAQTSTADARRSYFAPWTITAVGTPSLTAAQQYRHPSTLFANGAWISTAKFATAMAQDASLLPPYTWHVPEKADTMEQSQWLKTTNAIVAREGTVRPDAEGGFYQFGDLGNYELLWYVIIEVHALILHS
jgi:hypothetical protein